MNYEDRVLCFVDILGFRSEIQQTFDKQGQDVASRIKNLADAFLFIHELLDIDKPDEMVASSGSGPITRDLWWLALLLLLGVPLTEMLFTRRLALKAHSC